MKNISNHMQVLSVVAALTLVSCNEDEITEQWLKDNPVSQPSVTGDPGTADLSKIVVLGTSLGAGFMDGALYDDGQSASFPNMLAAQMQVEGIGGGAFSQPDINSPNGFNMLLNGEGTNFGRSVLDLSDEAPVPLEGDMGVSLVTPYSGSTSELNNFSIPLAQSAQLVIAATGGPSEGNPAYNGFYARFASTPSLDGVTGSTPLTDAISAGGSFFIFEAGLNDVVLYAAGGATNDIGPLTSAASFEGQVVAPINAMASAMTNTETDFAVEGAVLNVPPILVFPFFQAVPYNAVPLDEATADALNTAYAGYNAGLGMALGNGAITQEEHDRRLLNFSASEGHPFVIEDDALTDLTASTIPSYRLTEETDIIPLTTATALATGIGTMTPASSEYVLTPEEQLEIETTRAAYNASLAKAVEDVNTAGGNLVLVDIESIFLDAAGISDGEIGITYQGIELSPDFAPNGIFSTDGIHPCDRGHGIIANTIISAINDKWEATIPLINVPSLLGPRFQE